MKTYRNAEGYPDFSAGKALEEIKRERRRSERLERMRAQEDYGCLCRQFRKLAEAKGFTFPGQIWLRRDNLIFKNG